MQMKSYNVLLPNLRYINKNIYFVSKVPIKLCIDEKIVYQTNFLLDISLTGEISYLDTDIKCTIIEKEHDDGLEVNLSYEDNYDIYTTDLKTIAQIAEATILGILPN